MAEQNFILFDCLTYNTSRHFAHCLYFSSPLRGSENTTQLVRYLHVLYVNPSIKVYVQHNKLHRLKVLLNSFLLNGYTLGFHPQT